ncbi:MAG: FecR domain-containing protein [Bacteroidales bacterium]|nr:FecR domain-containing protein [Bacteroidales bacterium]MDD3664146.1 FecR domain-containing protein [Bacteroidales bacterium]
MSHDTITDDVLLSYLLDELAAYERLQVEQWLEASEANRSRMARVEQAWTKVALPVAVPDDWDVDDAWNRFSRRVDVAELALKRRKTTVRRLLWMAVPAAAVLTLFFVIRQALKPVDDLLTVAAVSERIADTLPDGSVVVLAPGSQLSYSRSLASKQREVVLIGEAFFNVAHDSLHPFSVKTSGAVVRVVGTRFVVRTGVDTMLYVSVDEGKVALQSANSRPGSGGLYLERGEAGMVTRLSAVPQGASPLSAEKMFSYSGTVVFVDEPLENVAATLRKTHGIVLHLVSPQTGPMRLTATFGQQPAHEIVAVVAATLGLEMEQISSVEFRLIAQ